SWASRTLTCSATHASPTAGPCRASRRSHSWLDATSTSFRSGARFRHSRDGLSPWRASAVMNTRSNELASLLFAFSPTTAQSMAAPILSKFSYTCIASLMFLIVGCASNEAADAGDDGAGASGTGSSAGGSAGGIPGGETTGSADDVFQDDE